MLKTKNFYVRQVITNMIMVIVTLITVLPVILLFMASITSERELVINGYSFIPKEFSLDAYAYILHNKSQIFRAYGFTIFVTIVGTLGNMVMSTTLAYGLTDRRLPFKRVITFYIVFTMLFSGGLVPQYIMWSTIFKIRNTLLAYLLPNLLLSPMNVLLIRTYMRTNIPEAIYESGRIDGANSIQLLTNVALPLSKPILVTTGLFTGLNFWNDWTNGLYYITDSKKFSIQTLLNRMILDLEEILNTAIANSSGSSVQIPTVSIRMAIAFVALLPILIIYPFLQKYFQEGITLGAVKG